jgi:mono/diheme cytochrome c family protein
MDNPVSADEVSLQRGGVLFSLHCAVCHGPAGAGDGSLVEFWNTCPGGQCQGESARRPANLTEARIAAYPAGTIYRIISQGFGGMPPLRENLTERQRWDVVNHVHSLQPWENRNALLFNLIIYRFAAGRLRQPATATQKPYPHPDAGPGHHAGGNASRQRHL